MTAKYYAILTSQGAARLANAAALGTKLNLTQMAVGDANGKLPTPDPAQTKLISQKRIAPLNLLNTDPTNPGQIIAEQVIPENEGGFWIREIGLFDDSGVLIAVANCPETYKPLLQEGSGRTQTIRMILIVSSTTAITLKIDPAVVLATRQYVDDKVIEVKSYVDDAMKKHLDNKDPHPQYAPKASPTLTGTPRAPTPAAGNDSTQIATTAFVQGEAVSAVSDAALPFPAVWAPLSDDLRLLAGVAPYDTLSIAGQTLELPTKSLSFQRASTATYIDKSGNLQVAEINEPRFEKEGLLTEGQSTNLLIKSEPTAFPILQGGQTASQVKLDGVNAVRITGANTSAQSWKQAVGIQATVNAGDYYCLSMTIDRPLHPDGEYAYFAGSKFQLQTLCTYGNGLYIVYVAGPVTNTGEANPHTYFNSDVTVTRMQFEAMPMPTSYIPTNGAAVTRAPDILTLPMAGNIGLYECTVAMEYQITDTPGRNFLQRLVEYSRDINPRCVIQYTTKGDMSFLNSAASFQIVDAPAAGVTAISVGMDTLSCFTRGREIVSGVPQHPRIMTEKIWLGAGVNGGSHIFGHIRNVRMWNHALSDRQLKGIR